MRLAVRRRAFVATVVAVLVATVVGSSLVSTAWHALNDDITACQMLRGTPIFCYAGDLERGTPSRVPYLVIAGTVLVLLVLCWWLGRWAVRPLVAVQASVDRMGPTNLGQRLDPVGPGGDELKRLGDSIDALMDRVAAGYEGQRRFAANASHELRTPLAVQRTLVEVAMQAPESERDLTVLARQLIATNERNVELVEGLLVLSESDRGLADLRDVRLDLLVARVVDVHQDMAARHGVTLRTSAAEVTVAGDEVLLERLVSNLVQNAIRYNVPGGEVSITVGGEKSLTVTNTGESVPAEAVPRLFEPFRRLATDRTDRSGAGLGLAIVRSVVLAHHGSVEARPGPAGGLTVRVDLPLVQP